MSGNIVKWTQKPSFQSNSKVSPIRVHSCDISGINNLRARPAISKICSHVILGNSHWYTFTLYSPPLIVAMSPSKDFISFSKLSGLTEGENLLTGTPFSSHRNFSKFHFNPFPKIFEIKPLSGSFWHRNGNIGWAFALVPQSTLSNTGNSAPFPRANSMMSASVPGSWYKKLLPET